MILEDASSAGLASSDGNLIVYTYGGYLNNPLTPFKKQECRVYDFTQQKEVLRVQAGEGERIIGLPIVGDQREMAHIAYRSTEKDSRPYRLDLLDLDKRERYVRAFPDASFAKTWTQYPSYSQMVRQEREAFEVSTF